jgi:hypothetical protein
VFLEKFNGEAIVANTQMAGGTAFMGIRGSHNPGNTKGELKGDRFAFLYCEQIDSCRLPSYCDSMMKKGGHKMKRHRGCERIGAATVIGFFTFLFIVITTNSGALAAAPSVAAGEGHTVGVKTDGTVVCAGPTTYGQCDPGMNSWADITQAAEGYNTVGLKTDGTVVAVGNCAQGSCDVFDWNLGSSMGTGIQITGTSSSITMTIRAGDMVEFTVYAIVMDGAEVHYRFFTRAGYGEPDWGGNKWKIIQPYSPENTVTHTFDKAGIYFLASHLEYPGET